MITLNYNKSAVGSHAKPPNSSSTRVSGRTSSQRNLVVDARDALDSTTVQIHLNFTGTIGQGTFGQIEKATLTTPPPPTDHTGSNVSDQDSSPAKVLSVAVKRVLQDPRYKNRELVIMQKLSRHPNIVTFYYYYFSTSSSSTSKKSRRPQGATVGTSSLTPPEASLDVYLHLVLECFPQSLCEMIHDYCRKGATIPSVTVKMFTFQMLKALDYLHCRRICHRDIKSSNLLINESTLILKLCDFGSAKEMVPGITNVSYISSRYYRAPELLFGAQTYTCSIDTWGAGCVLAEMLRNQCLFMGVDSVDQLVKVIRVLGTPSPEDVASMNPMYKSYNFPDVQPCPVKLFFPKHTPSDLLALMIRMLVYNPLSRITPGKGLKDSCFDQLHAFKDSGQLPDGNPFPQHLFEVESEPVSFDDSLISADPQSNSAFPGRSRRDGRNDSRLKSCEESCRDNLE